ncbi:hypothetical protein J6590_031294 [Homalodisca vitripennis]|nr:hypothetical protein J6590_031294 [Homalodisca vitripennis]
MASRDRKDVFVNSDDFAAYVANVLDESGDEESDSEQDDMIHENNEMSDGTNDDSSDNESDDNPPRDACVSAGRNQRKITSARQRQVVLEVRSISSYPLLYRSYASSVTGFYW